MSTADLARSTPVDACTRCHGDWSTEEIRNAVEAGWGSIKPRRPLVAALVAASTDARPATSDNSSEPAGDDRAPEPVLRPDLYDPVAQLTLLVDFAVEGVRPGASLPPGVTEGLWGLAEGRDMDVRAMAMAILHVSEGAQVASLERLGRFLEPTSGSEALRRRWVASLTYLGDRWREAGRREDALAAYQAGLELLPDQVYLLQGVGVLLRGEGRPWLERAVAADPERALTLVSLALFYQATGDLGQARSVLEEAVAQDPNEPVIQQIYGRVLWASGDPASGRAALERAAELDWGSPGVLEDLMAVEEALGDQEAASATARRLLAFEPGHPEAQRIRSARPP